MNYHTLYYVTINGSVKYFSTNVTEIEAFAWAYGMIGYVEEEPKKIGYRVDSVVAQHPAGTFSRIKCQYFIPAFKTLFSHTN